MATKQARGAATAAPSPFYEWHIEVNYGYGDGWEHEVTEDTRAEAVERRREYRENCDYPVRIVRRRCR